MNETIAKQSTCILPRRENKSRRTGLQARPGRAWRPVLRAILSAAAIVLGAVLWCAESAAGESVEKRAGELIAKQDIAQLIQMYEQAIRTGTETTRTELSRTIISYLKQESKPSAATGELLTLLTRFGGAECVDFLAGLLSHEDPLFRNRAVLGLQRNASEAAAAVLRKALADAAKSEKRAEMIHALALRGDRASLPQFLQDAASADDAVRAAALLAVARLSDEPAGALFKAGMNQGSERARREACDAYLQHADRLAAAGRKANALAIYHELLGGPAWAKPAALMGLARVGGASELNTMLENMKAADRTVIRIAETLLANIPKSEQGTATLCANVRTAAPAVKARLLDVLARYADPTALDTVLEAAKDPNPAVSAAAVRALGRFDDPRASEALAALLIAGRETEAACIAAGISPRQASLMEALATALPSVTGPTRVTLVKVLGSGPAGKVLPVLLKTAEDPDTAVRSEAYNAIRRIGDPSVYADLVHRLAAETNGEVQTKAVNTLAALATHIKNPGARSAPVLATLAARGSPGRPALLLLLARVCSETTQEAGLRFLREALNTTDEDQRRAAIQALSEWRDPPPALEALLQAARKEPESVLGVLALRAYGKQLGALADRYQADVQAGKTSREKAQQDIIASCAEGLKTATQDTDRMGFLSVLGKQPHPAALTVVTTYLDDPKVKREAIQAALSIARPLQKSHADAVRPVLEKIMTATDDKQVQARAEELLEALEAKK